MSYTIEQFAAAFTEWERRWRENPDEFYAESARLAELTAETYGERCAPYFVSILNELGGEQ